MTVEALTKTVAKTTCPELAEVSVAGLKFWMIQPRQARDDEVWTELQPYVSTF